MTENNALLEMSPAELLVLCRHSVNTATRQQRQWSSDGKDGGRGVGGGGGLGERWQMHLVGSGGKDASADGDQTRSGRVVMETKERNVCFVTQQGRESVSIP